MNERKIKYIIFDLSEVLLTGIRDSGVALGKKHKIEKDENLPVPVNHKAAWPNPRVSPLLIPFIMEFFHGNVSEDDYVEAVLKQYPQIGTKEWLKEHIRENFTEVEGTREIILKLKRLGYKLALLSVHGKEWADYCEEKFKFRELFDVHSFSYDLKISKPDPMSFKDILKKLNAEPAECVFIDDSKTNVQAAEGVGIKSIWFSDADSLSSALREILPDF